MKKKFYAQIVLATFLAGSISACDSLQQDPRHSRDHHKMGYVSWGKDEFEFFGLSNQELDRKFEGELHFQDKDSSLVWNDRRPAHFHLQFDKNGKVVTVQRIFIDGAGCEIKGPFLTSKQDALEFSIDGLSSNENLDKEDQSKLATARKLLKDLLK